ncbi:MAG TPA: thioredoxin family protein [Bacteroides reticulotermitis]|nr:thioredoxin family protein [Bacteroides reticulotermitis]
MIKQKRYMFSILCLCGFLASCKQVKEPTIADWTRVHAIDADFIGQARHLIDSVGQQSPDSLELFVRQIADALCQQGQERLAVSVAAYPHGIDLSADDSSEIGLRLLRQLQLTGSKAPPLPQIETDAKEVKGSIVLFFESDCAACDTIINELKANYGRLQAEGIRIVSIASDSDQELYESHTSSLPWADKYCDFESFFGEYFEKWGVASTPTLYYLDRKGIVQGRYYTLKDINSWT